MCWVSLLFFPSFIGGEREREEKKGKKKHGTPAQADSVYGCV